MICGLRSLRWGWAGLAVLLAAALGFVPIPALASTDPVKDTRQIMAGTVTTAKVKNEYLSGARDGTAPFQGALAAYKAVRAAEQPAPAPKTWRMCSGENGTCYVVGTANVRYGFGTTWTAPRSVTGSIVCSNAVFGDPLPGAGKECDTDGQVGTAPAPTPVPPPPAPDPVPLPTTAAGWVPAPLAVGGYAISKGWVFRLTAVGRSTDVDPANRIDVYSGTFAADLGGQFPIIGADYWRSRIYRLQAPDLTGVAPAP